ncbi:MAG: single-stranded DNA-binding protein [Chloroflexi bacterium]|nr:single-stranded DNA-binding protein [Chloroflexota bacterium]MBM4454705.1 single-stranded DNA-binding protein [Chloroflexota bacterium]
MASMNKVLLIGNVGADPEMRFTPSGIPVTSFSVATNKMFTSPDGERKQETTWFRIVAFRKQAESCSQFLTKGQRVYVEGSLRTRVWEGQDGQKRTSVEVLADRVLFLDRQAVATLPSEELPGEGADESVAPEDLPF